MKMSNLKKWLSLVLCLALLAAAALSTVSLAETATETEETVILMTGTEEEPVIVGEGEIFVHFKVVDPDGNEAWFLVLTDEAETVGQALLENELIAGSESDYGLYVTSVCGIELIYTEENPHYWAFYIDDDYAQTGADATPLEDGVLYTFKAE